MVPIEETVVCLRVSALSDEIYLEVASWPTLARQTFGCQLVNSLDSVGANLVEGDGRGPGADALRFFRIARGSCLEARYWLGRAEGRGVCTSQSAVKWIDEVTEIAKMVNGLIAHRKSILPVVREQLVPYDNRDPFTEPS